LSGTSSSTLKKGITRIDIDNCKMVSKRCNTGRAKIYPWDVFKPGPVRSGNTTGSTKKQAGENGKATHN
jgi:hypothetical protein